MTGVNYCNPLTIPRMTHKVDFHVFGDTYFYNRVGVAIFVVTAHGKYMIGGVGGVGWGGIIASMYACGTS